MARPWNFTKLLQYAPLLYELVKAVMPVMPTREVGRSDEMRGEMAGFQRSVLDRLAEMENENTQLRRRLRELESLATTLQLWVWVGGGALFILFVIILIVVLTGGHVREQ